MEWKDMILCENQRRCLSVVGARRAKKATGTIPAYALSISVLVSEVDTHYARLPDVSQQDGFKANHLFRTERFVGFAQVEEMGLKSLLPDPLNLLSISAHVTCRNVRSR